ncbi:MAG: TonB-dependent receptor, partial [Gammaproteobacteria bacterium]|nr:TonB-dependent receptor [Gammaproteobacteria bacterium]
HRSFMLLPLLAAGFNTGINASEIDGTLKNQQNQAIQNALLKVRDSNVTTRSDSEGRFKLNLPNGKYTIDVEAGRTAHFHQEIVVTNNTTTLQIKMPYHMDEIIVVRANPLEHTRLDMATPTIVMSGDELAMNRASTFGDILETQPGISMASFGPAVARPVIRGLAGGRVLIANNQMTVQDASTNSNDHDVGLEPLLAEQIEVLKGPATLLYGSGAIGGIINVTDSRINQDGADGYSGGVEMRLGDSTTGEKSLIAKLNGGSDTFTYHLDAFSTEMDDIEIPGSAESEIFHEANLHEEEYEEDQEEEMEGLLENSYFDSKGITTGATWIRDWGYIGMALNHTTKEYGVPGEHAHEEEEEHDEEEGHDEEESESVSIDMEQTRIDLQAEINNPFSGFNELFIGFTNTDYEHAEIEGHETGTMFNNDATELKSFLRHETIHGWRGIIGMQWSKRDFEAIGDEAFVPPSETASYSFFGLEEKSIDNMKFEFGLRYENQNIDVVGYDSIDESVTSVSAGMVMDIQDGHRFAVNLASAERVPTVEELYSFGEHLATQTFEIGNPNLDPESVVSLDLSYRFNTKRLDGEINAYWNSYSDFIYGDYRQNTGSVYDLNGNLTEIHDDFPIVAYEQADADIRGIEIQVDWQLITDASYDLFLGLYADMIEAEFDASQDELPRIPPWKTGVNLHYDWDLLSADLSYTHYADQDKIAVNELPTKGFNMLNFEVGYRLFGENHDFLLFLKGKNLLDEEARDHTSYLKDFAPRAGRSIAIGVRYQF